VTYFHRDEAKIFLCFLEKNSKWPTQKKMSFFFLLHPYENKSKIMCYMDGTQFLILLWFTAKNEGGNHIIA
jgi:hypothetical protein